MKWGDGTPVTAKDVAFTLEVGRHPLSGVASSEGYKRIIKFDAKDDRRFTMTIDRVTFDYNSIELPARCRRTSRSRSSTPIPPSTATRPPTTPTRPIPASPSAPIRIVEIVPGSRIVLEQNPTWTGEKPHFKRIVVKIIENTAALEANLLSGNVDYVLGELGLSLDQALAFEKRHKDKYNVIYKPALIYEHIDANLDNKLLEDRRVRQAILMAIDRKAISEKLFEGKHPVADGADQPARSDVQPDTKHYPYDPAAARKLLDEAGFSDDQERRAPQRQGRAPVARDHHHRRQPRARAGDAGDPEPAPPGRHRAAHQGRAAAHLLRGAEPPPVHRACHVCLGAAARGRAALDSCIPTEIPTAENAWSGQNYPGYRNPAMDKALDAAERELDFDKRRALFADIQRIHAEDLPVLPLFFRVDPFVIPKPLKGVTPTGHLNSSTLWIEQWRWEN